MNRFKNHLPWIAGLFFGMVFLVLMGVRLGVFTFRKASEPLAAPTASARESWMDIFRQDQKIGYTYRRLAKKGTGFELQDNSYLRLNAMGLIQDMRIQTTAFLNDDFSLSSFSFDLGSGLFDVSATGYITNKTLYVSLNGQESAFPLKEPVFLLSGIFDAATVKALTPGNTAMFYVFDPATLEKSPVRVTLEGNDALTIMGKPIPTTRYTVEYMGLSQTAWADEKGDIVQETGLLGIKLVRSSKASVSKGFHDGAMDDLTESISVAAGGQLTRPDKPARLKLRVDGIGDLFFLDGGRQAFKDGVLTIVKEDLSPSLAASPSGAEEFLKPTLTIQSDHPKIRQLTSGLVSPDGPPLEKIHKIMAWIAENIEKRPVISVPNALQTLENRMGDCNEHAVLFAAMARSAGIPTQVEAGLVYMNGRFYYHAWNVVRLGDWITVDALMGQMPADVTHIRLVRGDGMNQLDLVHAIDSIRLKILEPQE